MRRSSVWVLGSGTAFNQDGRGSQALWVGPRSGPAFLVDIGPTALAAMESGGAGTEGLDRLFLTHLHGDHTAGWPFLLLRMIFLDRRERPFEVYGPEGTRECLEGLMDLCYREVDSERRFEIRYRELPVAETIGLEVSDELQADVLPMEHHPTSIGWRFQLGGRRIAVSGDTAWCSNLVLLADCETLFLECTTVEPQPFTHLSLVEVREHRAELPAPRIVLVHLTDTVAEALAVEPIPGTIAAHDGLRIDS